MYKQYCHPIVVKCPMSPTEYQTIAKIVIDTNPLETKANYFHDDSAYDNYLKTLSNLVDGEHPSLFGYHLAMRFNNVQKHHNKQ